MAKNTNGFLTDDQKLKYYSGIAKIDMNSYPNGQTLKVYEGAEILVYHYDSMGWPVFDAVALCSGINLTEKGLRISLVNKKTYKISKVGEVPSNLWGLGIVTYAPYRCTIEKTVKTTAKYGRHLQGITGGMCLRSKSHPRDKVPGHVHAMSMSNVNRFFSQEELDYANEQAERNHNS